MKLRTRIVLISCLAVLVSAVAVSALVWGRTRKSYMEEAFARAECGRLERLSRKMMKLLELDRDMELSFVKLPAREIFEMVEKSCKELLKEKELTLEISEQGENFEVERDLMVDAVLNLVDNAAKASEPGGKIILRAGADFIEVQDFGGGIPKEEQERILEPFYMVDKSRSRKAGGAGLGLALVELIAGAHGCELEIESEAGAGTVMRLRFAGEKNTG